MMNWPLVGRVEQIEHIRAALKGHASGPVLITGEPGMGRTSILRQALEHADAERDTVLRIDPAGRVPFAALSRYLPTAEEVFAARAGASDVLSGVTRALTDQAGGRRLVVALDDAHLIDHASLLALRELGRRGEALLLATRPTASADPHLDATESLRYECEIQVVHLPPLSTAEVAALLTEVVGGHVHPATVDAVREATGGNPRKLRDLLLSEQPVHAMVATRRSPNTDEAGGPLVDAAWRAWQELAIDRAAELCRMAICRGHSTRIAAIWASILLLRGHAEEGRRFLESLPSGPSAQSQQLALVEAMTLALGLGRTAEAGRFLQRATSRLPQDRILAYRAWLLAVTGRPDKAAESIEVIGRSDRETAAFLHATRAAITFAAGRHGEAVFHLRRALVVAENCPGIPPWLPPYLKAYLIDALLLAGRIREATNIAGNFHAATPGSGWQMAVALAALTTSESPAPEHTPSVRESAPTP